VTRDQLTERLLAEKARPILRALQTLDGQVLLEVLRETVEELRDLSAIAGRPIDPYALAMAEGAQRLIDKLVLFRDAADKLQRSLTDG
jgi:hypothetical protein